MIHFPAANLSFPEFIRISVNIKSEETQLHQMENIGSLVSMARLEPRLGLNLPGAQWTLDILPQ